ncbi:vWA domain-containing protein [Flavobacterium sp. N2270]|uniref:vWA domain-containing protein n=1 Tax=Flavobacterium sp. N2270 TaxID=2986831 RepID=UPI0022251A1F|nr:BatA and WFA domain-containing protein [Flavobacterium sp. N2270]
MQFKHPEILYFLFLLVIPILVHLFQFRRFKKEYFTNVKLLKEIQIQTRKSKSIKKWLLLATRLLLLAAIIFAFAQPFFTAKDAENKENELVVLLDNSFSMQAKGAKGELLKRSIQELLESFPENQTFSLLTNTEVFWDTDIKSIQKELQQLDYASTSFELDALINQVELKKPNVSKDYMIISDGISVTSEKINTISENNEIYWLQPKAEKSVNISIEKATITEVSDAFYTLEVVLKAFGTVENETPLTLYDNDKAIAKTQVTFEKSEQKIKLSIPKKEMAGRIVIQDNSLQFDNEFFFTIQSPKKTNVAIIGEASKNKFLHRIYTNEDFVTYETTLELLDFNRLENQQTIVLNEVKEISQALQTNLVSFYEKGGNVIVIPSTESNLESLNGLSKKIGNVTFSNPSKTEKQITKISFNHPVYKNVFEKNVTNFQYPKVNSNFIVSKNSSPILQFEDAEIFLTSVTNKLGTVYFFASAINKTNSNFQNSPLIVPTFFNMTIGNDTKDKLAFTISENETKIIEADLEKDEVVSFSNESNSFIPLQQILSNKVKLTFGDYPEQAGNYNVKQKDKLITSISFNFPRNESDVTLQSTLNNDNFAKINSVDEVLNDLHTKRTDTVLWKWFIIATLLLLLIELLIQKFVK